LRRPRPRAIIQLVRASDRLRERTVAALGDGYAAGCIGPDTLSMRVDQAYGARSVGELRALTADLPRRWTQAAREAAERIRDAFVAERVATVRIASPPDGTGPWTIGRASECRLTVAHSSVSRRHAELRRTATGWEVRDLGSTNGTWVNGWRVVDAALHPGDDLVLGGVRVELR
jgi:pSer/pThr/pTyr-binding forkhead associated (FHA) protein